LIKKLPLWLTTVGKALGVKDYFVRYESQQRGAIYAHENQPT